MLGKVGQELAGDAVLHRDPPTQDWYIYRDWTQQHSALWHCSWWAAEEASPRGISGCATIPDSLLKARGVRWLESSTLWEPTRVDAVFKLTPVLSWSPRPDIVFAATAEGDRVAMNGDTYSPGGHSMTREIAGQPRLSCEELAQAVLVSIHAERSNIDDSENPRLMGGPGQVARLVKMDDATGSITFDRVTVDTERASADGLQGCNAAILSALAGQSFPLSMHGFHRARMAYLSSPPGP